MSSSHLHNEDNDGRRRADDGRGHPAQRKLAEEALRQSEQRLKTIIEDEPACVKLVSADGRLIEMNPAGLQMIDADDLSQVIGAGEGSPRAPADRERFMDTIRLASTGLRAQAGIPRGRPQGTQRWLETRAVPFYSGSIARASRRWSSASPRTLTHRKLLEY